MRSLVSWLRARSRKTSAPRRPAGIRLGIERLEARETPSGGLGGGGHIPPAYYLPPGSVPVQVVNPAPSHGHGGADVVQVKT
jgi:hypothetical protein